MAGVRGSDPEAVARAVLLDRLSDRPQTRAQLAALLQRRGVPEDVGDRVLDRFEEVGLVDDAAFATAWVESRHAGRGLARRALAHELRQRGVAPESVTQALERLEPGREDATARGLVRGRLRSMSRLDPAAKARRLMGLLARKGYPPVLAAAVVRDELARAGADLDGVTSTP